ncbi:MAG: hypothetical protein NT027_12410 [Proteobacteria bacterium]|nr:hypothetical protein [Pseudomonadota bacterium]
MKLFQVFKYGEKPSFRILSCTIAIQVFTFLLLLFGCESSFKISKRTGKKNAASNVKLISVSADKADGRYITGDAIAIQVNFSEVVFVKGNPSLTLETGSVDAIVDYSAGSGSKTLTFNYTVASAHSSTDLDYLSTSSLALNSGTIIDSFGVSVSLKLPGPGEANSLGANKALVINGVASTATSGSVALTTPTISAISTQSVDVNSSTSAIPFTIGDTGSTLDCSSSFLSLSSSDHSLVLPGSVVWGGTYPTCTAVVTPVSTAVGNVTLTVTVSNSSNRSAQSSFNLTLRGTFALGQSSSVSMAHMEKGMSTPVSTIIVGGKLFVCDSGNHRVLVWNTIPTASGQAASFALGQPDLFSTTANNGGISASTLNTPTGIYSDGTKLFVVDRLNNRVLAWNSIPTSSGQAADFVLGQVNFTSMTANGGGGSASATTLNGPWTVVGDGTRLFVSDYSNNRILIWNTIPTSTAAPANIALGQVDLVAHVSSSATATGLYLPGGVYSTGTKLIVADTYNNRILIWNTMPTVSGQAPDLVLGQTNFTSFASNSGGLSSTSVNQPYGVFVVGTKMFVADMFNSRILVWNTIPTTTGQAADYVLGQPNFSSNTGNNGGISGSTVNFACSTYSDGSKLFVADYVNNRVLVWNSIPTTSGESASFVLGQTDFSQSTANHVLPASNSLRSPQAIQSDGTRLFVADRINHRILVWNSIPTSSGQAANVVLGQSSFSTRTINTPSISGSTLSNPYGVFSNGTKLFVADSTNARVLVWNSIPTSNGQAADFALGQPDLVSNTSGFTATGLDVPSDVFSVGTKLFVSDLTSHRVLVWNALPTSSGQAANFALGQPNLTTVTANTGGLSGSTLSGPTGIFSDGTKLFIADASNHRVLVWNAMPTVSGQSASFALGQPNLTSNTANNGGVSASSLSSPTSVYSDGTKLYVADGGNNRILVWNTIPTTNGQAADVVLGQTTLTTNTVNFGGFSETSLNAPASIIKLGAQIFISDKSNNRIIVRPAP